jgi:hypothetical protein|nr:MAG TPA_asm: N-deoxyribosyltransferase [Caudoviricetes sp.]
MSKKAMISQPMRGKTREQIESERAEAVKMLEAEGYEVVETVFDFDKEKLAAAGVVNVPLYYLSKAIEAMSKCELVYFAPGWSDARGCRVEYDAAMRYGLQMECIGWEKTCEEG